MTIDRPKEGEKVTQNSFFRIPLANSTVSPPKESKET